MALSLERSFPKLGVMTRDVELRYPRGSRKNHLGFNIFIENLWEGTDLNATFKSTDMSRAKRVCLELKESRRQCKMCTPQAAAFEDTCTDTMDR